MSNNTYTFTELVRDRLGEIRDKRSNEGVNSMIGLLYSLATILDGLGGKTPSVVYGDESFIHIDYKSCPLLDSRPRNLSQYIRSLRESLQERNARVKEQDAQIDRLRKNVERLTSNFHSANTRKKNLETLVQELSEKLKKMPTHGVYVSKAQQEIEAFEEFKKQEGLRREMRLIYECNQQTVAENERLQGENKALRERNLALLNNYECRSSQTLVEAGKRLDSENMALSEQNKSLAWQLNDALTLNSEIGDKNKHLEVKCIALSEENMVLLNQVKDLTKRNDNLKSWLEDRGVVIG